MAVKCVTLKKHLKGGFERNVNKNCRLGFPLKISIVPWEISFDVLAFCSSGTLAYGLAVSKLSLFQAPSGFAAFLAP